MIEVERLKRQQTTDSREYRVMITFSTANNLGVDHCCSFPFDCSRRFELKTE